MVFQRICPRDRTGHYGSYDNGEFFLKFARVCVGVDFQCHVIFTCVRACVKFAFANEIEAMHERSLVSVKVEPRLTSRLSSAVFILPLFYLRD